MQFVNNLFASGGSGQNWNTPVGDSWIYMSSCALYELYYGLANCITCDIFDNICVIYACGRAMCDWMLIMEVLNGYMNACDVLWMSMDCICILYENLELKWTLGKILAAGRNNFRRPGRGYRKLTKPIFGGLCWLPKIRTQLFSAV